MVFNCKNISIWLKFNTDDGSGRNRQLFQYIVACIVAINSLNVGITFGWDSPSISKLMKLESSNHEISNRVTWLPTVFIFGRIVGLLSFIILANKLGRKTMQLLSIGPTIIGWIMISSSEMLEVLLIARFIQGVYIQLAVDSGIIYISEISEPKTRGKVMNIQSLNTNGGSLPMVIMGSYMSIQNSALVCLICPVVFTLLFVWMPESPYFYKIRGLDEKARESLKKLRMTENIDSELLEIHKYVNDMDSSLTFFELFTEKYILKPMVILVFIYLFNMFTGYTLIDAYTHIIFELANVSLSVNVSVILSRVIQIVALLLTFPLADRYGRKILLLASAIGCSVCLILLGTYFYIINETTLDVSNFRFVPLVAVLLFIVFQSIGYGIVPSILIGEYFPMHVKAKVVSLIRIMYLLVSMGISQLGPYMANLYGIYSAFWLFSCCSVLSIFFIIFLVPETKQKSLFEIQQFFRQNTISQ